MPFADGGDRPFGLEANFALPSANLPSMLSIELLTAKLPISMRATRVFLHATNCLQSCASTGTVAFTAFAFASRVRTREWRCGKKPKFLEDEFSQIDRTLRRLDSNSPRGSWTVQMLRNIADHPGTPAAEPRDLHRC